MIPSVHTESRHTPVLATIAAANLSGTLNEVGACRLAEVELSSCHVINSILNASLDGFWKLDSQGYIRIVNGRYLLQSGYTRDELLGMHISQIDDNEDASAAAAHIQKVIYNGGDRFETVHRRKDGST